MWRPKGWRRSARRRVGIRTRIVVAVTLVGILAASITAGALLYSTRTIVLEARQNSILDTFSDQTNRSVADLPHNQAMHRDVFQTTRLPERTVKWNVGSSASTDPTLFDSLPEGFADRVERSNGELLYLRTTLDGAPVFIVGQLIDRDYVARLGIVSVYPLRVQMADLNSLLRTGVGITAAVALAGGAVGLLVGRRISLPLTRLRARVREVGAGGPPPESSTGSPDVDEVQREFVVATARLDASNARLAEQEARARQLVADVSHELRTPLTAMLAYSEILDDAERAEREELLLAARGTAAGVRQLTRLTEQLLDMSRRDAGQGRMSISEFDLAELVRGVREGLLGLDPAGVAAIECEVQEGIVLRSDRGRVEAIVSNLLSNAIRHGRPPVRVRAQRSGATVTIAVSDGGDGVPEAERERVFERFVRLDRARGATHESNGLGLAIVRENARMLGGDVVMAADDGRTVVRATLPLRSAAAGSDAAPAPADGADGDVPDATPERPGDGA